MRNSKSLKMNAAMNAILAVSSFIFPLITFPYVSRVLFPENIGKVSFVGSIITYFDMVAQLGIPTYGIRACSKVRDDREKLTRTVHEILFINLCMTVLSYLILIVLVTIIPRFADQKILFIAMSSVVFLNSIGMEWLFKAMEQYSYITIRSVVFKLIALLAMFLLVRKKEDYVVYGAISIFASSASNILNLISAKRFIWFHPVGGYDIKHHIAPILVFFAMTCATTVYTNLDTVMVGFIGTDTDVGYYNAAVKIKNVLISVVTSLSAVLLPRLSFYVEKKNMDAFYNACKKALHFVIIATLPLTVFFILFARHGILFLCGNAYLESISPMQWIMPTVFFVGLSNITGIQMLIPLGEERLVLYSVVAGAIVDFVLNLILIPTYASTGAAIGTLCAEIVVTVFQLISLRKVIFSLLQDIPYIKIIGACAIATGVSTFSVLLALNSFWTLVIAAFLMFGTYFCMLFLMKDGLIVDLASEMWHKLKR